MEKSRRKSQRKYKGAKFTQAEPALIEGTKLPTKMKESFLKIIALLIIVGLNWTGLSAVIKTSAFYNDTEISSENSFSAGTLDFSLSSSQDFFPPTPGEPNQLIRDIGINNEGSLSFEYQIRVDNYSGPLCGDLQLSANLDNGVVECSTTSLTGFTCGPFEISGPSDSWQFSASLPEGFSPGFIPKSCEFELIFEGWQPNLVLSSGFSDVEEIENKVTKHISDLLPRVDIVINEFLPNPVGSDSAPAPDGEWVELYNRGESSISLSDWFLMDLAGETLSVPDSTIAPGEFLVVYLNEAHYPGWLNNSSQDGVALIAPENAVSSPFCFGDYCLVDAHFYQGDEVLEGKTFARIPDGSDTWYDPEPTPGAANQLSPEEITQGLQPEPEPDQQQIFEQLIPHLAQMTTQAASSSDENSGLEETTAGSSAEQQDDENSGGDENLGDMSQITEGSSGSNEATTDEVIDSNDTADDELFTVEEPQEPISNPLDIDVIETTTAPEYGIAFGEETIVEEEPVAEEPTEEEGEPDSDVDTELIQEQPGDEEEPVDEPEVVEVDDSGDDEGDDEGDEEGDGGSGGENAGGDGSEDESGGESANEGGAEEL